MTAQRFLVPGDFSEDGNQVLEYAIGLASKLGARVTLLHVIQPPPWGGRRYGCNPPLGERRQHDANAGHHRHANDVAC
jgi:hypothetical protein